jgi:hypothetical protein
MSNNSSTDCDSIFRDPEDALILRAVPLGEILKMPFPKPTEIVPGLIFGNQNTVVLVGPGLYDHALMLAIIISQIVAAGGHIPPFGGVSSLKTHLLIGVGNRALVLERLNLMRSRFKMPFVRHRADLNLHLNFRNPERWQSLYLNQLGGQRTFKDSISDGTELVVFADANYWLTTKEKNPHDYRRFNSLHADLNEMGIATLSFVQSGKVSAGVLENEFLLDGSTTFVELTKDAGAPTEFGGGFNVVRAKISEHDPIPLRFSFWYTNIDGKLDFGWECRDPADSSNTAKEVEIFERQKRVAEMLALNIPQKDIAAALKVDPATVSRDKAKIKVKERPKPAEPDDFDDGMTKGG